MSKKVSKLAKHLTRGSQPARAHGANAGRYQKGHKKTGGRRKGTPNVISRNVKEAIIDGLTEFGGPEGLKGFVKKVAKENISTAAMLLRAVLAMDTKINISKDVNIIYQTFEEMQREAELLGLPPESIVELKDYRRLPPPAAELEPQPVEVNDESDKKS
jgi:hypothetical protein